MFEGSHLENQELLFAGSSTDGGHLENAEILQSMSAYKQDDSDETWDGGPVESEKILPNTLDHLGSRKMEDSVESGETLLNDFDSTAGLGNS